MPTVVLLLKSERGRLVTDTPTVLLVGVNGGQVHQDDIRTQESAGEVVCSLFPDRYRLELDVPGYKRLLSKFEIDKAATKKLALQSRCTLLPTFSELGDEQQRLLGTLDPLKTAGGIWNELSENKAATFFQITHALSSVALQNGAPLSTLVEKVRVLGGASLTGRDTAGKWRRVVGWRMHVKFSQDVDPILLTCGFARDPGKAHETHSRFGFVKSHREKKGKARLQVTTDKYGTGADIDVDVSTPVHMSAPHDVYAKFVQRFPEVKEIYRVV